MQRICREYAGNIKGVSEIMQRICKEHAESTKSKEYAEYIHGVYKEYAENM